MISTSFFSLVTKKPLTQDVWELDFMVDTSLDSSLPVTTVVSETTTPTTSHLLVHPGQYILFILPSGLRRAYSIGYSFNAEANYAHEHTIPEGTQIFRFIIKRLDHVGAGSQEVCDIAVGGTLKGMWPMGHFALPAIPGDTLFIGTGTGFAPLYYQMRSLCESGIKERLHFVFGVRSQSDIFYHHELNAMIGDHANLSFTQYLSKPIDQGEYQAGYVTDYLTPENIAQYQTFSICGSPAMVKNAREILESAGVSKDQIKFEQY